MNRNKCMRHKKYTGKYMVDLVLNGNACFFVFINSMLCAYQTAFKNIIITKYQLYVKGYLKISAAYIALLSYYKNKSKHKWQCTPKYFS